MVVRVVALYALRPIELLGQQAPRQQVRPRHPTAVANTQWEQDQKGAAGAGGGAGGAGGGGAGAGGAGGSGGSGGAGAGGG